MAYLGDANNDNVVNSIDAAAIYQALSSAGVSALSVNPPSPGFFTYFPNVDGAKQPDANNDNYITEDDALEVLRYAAAVGVNGTYTGSAGQLVEVNRVYWPGYPGGLS